MPHEIVIPRLGWSMEEGTFVRWLKADGDFVRAGEPLFELEGDKAIQEVEALDSGTLCIAPDAPPPQGAVLVGALIGYLLGEGEEMPKATSRNPHVAARASEEATSIRHVSESSTGKAAGHGASPRARRTAKQHGVDLSGVEGTGRGGRIRERDVLASTAARITETTPNSGVAPHTQHSLRSNLAGQVALVTGAARGIGEAIARRLAANGATVYFTDVDEGGVREAARLGSGRSLAMDVTKVEQIAAALDEITRRDGRLDLVVNNAGVNTLRHRVTIDEFPREEWDRILAVDLTGLYEVSRAAAGIMRRQGRGRIINIASIAGLVPLRLQCAFTAAKAGVVNLTKAMAIELGQYGILVNGIAPGSTLTDGTRQLFYGPDGKFSDRVQRMLDHVPLGRPASVDEIAVAALFLADPDNSYMTGHVLTIDGGWTAGYHRDF
jgi:NAD(P)-dependent dehydrogenase (short-subunit alcohol dehydrogenase family)